MTCHEFGLEGVDGQLRLARVWVPSRETIGVVGIVHGLGEHSGRYVEVALQLSGNGFAVVAYDQHGHGRSGGTRGHVPRYKMLLDDIGALLRELERRAQGLPLFLYGHSLGGNLVANFALRRRPQVSGVVVASPLLLPVTEPAQWKFVLAHALNRVWPGATFDKGVDPADLSHDDEAVQRFRDDPLVHHRVSARLGIEMLAAGRWALEHAGELSLPTLLMHGDADQVTSVAASREFAAESAPNCTLKIWEGLFHELHWEKQRAEVLRYVIAWLRDRVCEPQQRTVPERP